MRSALVTGASRGIGRGIAFSLATQGFGLTITSRAGSDLKELTPQLLAAGSPRVVYLPADMAERDELPDVASLHGQTFGSMSALIVNAGVGTAGRVESFKLERLSKILEVNFTSAFILVQAALPLLRSWADSNPETGAKIIGMSSITGAYAEPGLAVYGASKAALMSLIETVNLEESPQGVTATAIAPAFVQTDMSAWATDAVPADSMIKVEDIVGVVNMIIGLSSNASITRIAISRSGSTGYSA